MQGRQALDKATCLPCIFNYNQRLLPNTRFAMDFDDFMKYDLIFNDDEYSIPPQGPQNDSGCCGGYLYALLIIAILFLFAIIFTS